MDTVNPPPANSVVAAELYWGWVRSLDDAQRALAAAVRKEIDKQ